MADLTYNYVNSKWLKQLPNILANFVIKNVTQELSKIVQSGHLLPTLTVFLSFPLFSFNLSLCYLLQLLYHLFGQTNERENDTFSYVALVLHLEHYFD